MFAWFHKRPQMGPWQNAELAPVNTVLILAVRSRSTPGAVGPIYYAPTARIGWKDEAGAWTDFTTGAPLDIQPDRFMHLPALDSGPPALNIIKRRHGGRRWRGSRAIWN